MVIPGHGKSVYKKREVKEHGVGESWGVDHDVVRSRWNGT